MKEYLASIVRSLVSHPEEVSVTETEEERGAVLELRASRDDIGKIIGRQGRTIRALRLVLSAACAKAGKRYFLEVRD